MAGESSSNSCVVVEVGEEYPYPSHVCAPNFVTVKLSGKEMFALWKTQMLCLLEAHGMLGFIHTISPPQTSNPGTEREGDYMLWRRSDALVKGWILGSLSKHVLRHIINLLKTNQDFTAKDIWDLLLTIYGDTAPLLQQPDEESVKQAENAKSNNEEKSEEEKKKEEEQKKKEEERAVVHQSLYEATLNQDFEAVDKVLKRKTVTLREKITINGNTALHVAISTTKNSKFLESMLNLAANDNQELDMQNSEGSTVLHVAAIVGNLDAAKILVNKNPNLLLAKDNEGHTPLARALSNMHTDTYLYLLNQTYNARVIEMRPLFAGTSGDELLVNAISSNDYNSALALLMHYHNLHSDAVLMAIAQNFPRNLKPWETTVYKIFRYSERKVPRDNWMLTAICCLGLHSLMDVGAIPTLIRSIYYGIQELLHYITWKTVNLVARWTFKFVSKRHQLHDDATRLLKSACNLIKSSESSSSHHRYYTNSVFEATRQNAYEVVVLIVSFFPDAIWTTNEDGHNIIQYAVINRSENVYNLLYQMSEHKNVYKTIKDPLKNNLLHLAARLAPTNKLNYISGAALQIQRELQWFKEVEGFVCPLNIMQKNSSNETPEMVFTREHKELVIEGEKWMKATAESYTITTALITTIVFAAAITVPGGNNQDGIPSFTNNIAFTIFAISDAISLFTSVTSLLMFLSILTTRFAEQDFLFKLPTKLLIGLATLFISTTAMIIAFGATLFLVFGQRKSWILIPIAALTCLPIISFVTLQFPLIFDLVSSTYGRSIFGKKREFPFY